MYQTVMNVDRQKCIAVTANVISKSVQTLKSRNRKHHDQVIICTLHYRGVLTETFWDRLLPNYSKSVLGR